MTTPRKKWPHEAEWARLDAIALARDGRTALIRIMEMTHDAGTVRAIAKACENFREIESKLTACKGDQNV